jgi:flagellar biosynthetic protein FliR
MLLQEQEVLTFFAVLVRFSVLLALIPLTGERNIPAVVKVLLALVVTVALYPALVSKGWVHPQQALQWSQSVGPFAQVIATEVVVGLVLGFVSRLTFDAVQMAGELAGTAMGLSSASVYDPQQESQSQLLSKVQMTLAMLLFFSLDGHHMILRAVLQSYRYVGLGEFHVDALFAQGWLSATGRLFKMAVQLSAPVAVVLFAINVVYGLIAKAIPQLNVLVLSMSVSGLVGLLVLAMTIPGFFETTREWFSTMGDDLIQWMKWMGHG